MFDRILLLCKVPSNIEVVAGRYKFIIHLELSEAIVFTKKENNIFFVF